jgi:asparagine synthase (glutamine-hydrolysing)
LSILDLSEAGSQPMKTQNDELVITFNGEIYNFIELRQELEKKSIQFKSTSDTEVILKGYEAEGEDFFKKLNGIFAFSICDQRNDKLLLYRDPVGVKPCYYSHQGDKLAFASEVKPLFALNSLEPRPDFYAIDLYFSLNYIPAPYTGFENIYQLMPGHLLTYELGEVSIKRINTLNERPPHRSETVIRDFDQLFLQTLERQSRSDVPVSLFLSGGIDSS